ncbi:MAG: hypothetical protein R6V46_10355 [Desulfatiglandaceae bacterium]
MGKRQQIRLKLKRKFDTVSLRFLLNRLLREMALILLKPGITRHLVFNVFC